MPEFTAAHFGLIALMLVAGVVLGWILRANRCAKEKTAVSAGWQSQFESQQSERSRLAEQNESQMGQISQYQASQQSYSNRARELADSLKEAFGRRDELQRRIKDIRGNLEAVVAQRDRLQTDLTSWQNRVPPLVEKFQERDEKTHGLEEKLHQAQTRLQVLEEMVGSDQTRIEPVDAASLPGGGDASNEPIALTSTHDASELQDQIDEEANLVFDGDSDNGSVTDTSVDESAFAAIFTAPDVIGEDPSDNDRFLAIAENDGDAAGKDDLKKIKGIGPSIEKTLNGLGIWRFHQISEMSEFDIDRIAQQLKGFRSRIYRENWIDQARDFQSRKNNDTC